MGISEDSNQFGVERHRATGERVVEVEHDRVVVDLADDARDRVPVARRKTDHIADLVVAVGVALCSERSAANALHERGIALAERLARSKSERRLAAFGEAEQARFDGRRELAAAERKRRRPRREGVDEGDAVGVAQPVVQGDERAGLDALQGEPVRGT